MCCADLRLPFLSAEGWLQVLCFSSMLLQSGQAPKLSLLSWVGSRAWCIPVIEVLVVLSSMHRQVPLPLSSGCVLLYLVTWDRCWQQHLMLLSCSATCSCSAAGANCDGDAGVQLGTAAVMLLVTVFLPPWCLGEYAVLSKARCGC